MYQETLDVVTAQAEKKATYLSRQPLGYFTAAMLAGAYVGIGVLLAFIVGAPLAAAHSPLQKLVMGASFGIALALVVFAGGELFTGNNMTLAIGWWARRTTVGQLLSVWATSWVGNLVGAIVLAALLFFSDVLNDAPGLALVQSAAEKKMHMAPHVLLVRGLLCNWLVCLAVWSALRMKSESGKLLMIAWCLYAFVAAGFEHSVANMTLLALALLQPHGAAVTLAGMGHNLLWVTVGNILGGALFVGGAYWVASRLPQPAPASSSNPPSEKAQATAC
jgi:nitrite transporter NirC